MLCSSFSTTTCSRPGARGWVHQELTQQKSEVFPVLSHLNALKAQWTSKVIEIPDDWIAENPVERGFTSGYKSEELAPIVNILRRVRDMIAPLSLEAQQSRSLDFIGPEPDFLSPASEAPEHPESGIPIEQSGFMDNFVNFLRLVTFLRFRRCDRDDAARLTTNKLAEILQELPGFFLRRNVSNGFAGAEENNEPVNFGLLVRQHGSRPEVEWPIASPYDPPIWPQRKAVALAMRISDTHPAVIMGITDQVSSSFSGPSLSCAHSESLLSRLARQIQPSLEAVLKVWKMRQEQHGNPMDPPPWMVLFGFITTADVVKIVAHYPNTHNVMASEDQNATRRTLRNEAGYCSCVIDEIPHHSEVWWHERCYEGPNGIQLVAAWGGPVDDDVWIRHRLRLFVALQTILKNSKRIAAIWDEIDWPHEIWDAEDELEKRHAEWDTPTPSPSNNGDEDSTAMVYEMMWEANYVEYIDEGSDSELNKEKEMKNRDKVLAWRKKLPSSYAHSDRERGELEI